MPGSRPPPAAISGCSAVEVTVIAPSLRVESLSDRHHRDSFTSSVEGLDGYLRQQAGQETRRRVTSCFVLVAGDDPAPIGYYTLAATSLALTELPEALAKRLPRYPVVPATLMGRLAVDARHQGQGHGELLLFDGFSRRRARHPNRDRPARRPRARARRTRHRDSQRDRRICRRCPACPTVPCR
jgi:GNAT superfamily N-acetyltransferase